MTTENDTGPEAGSEITDAFSNMETLPVEAAETTQGDAKPELIADPVEAAPEPERHKNDGLVKRIGEITAKRREAEQRAESLAAELKALRESSGLEPAPATTGQPGERTFTAADVRVEAERIAAANDFTARCNTMFDAGIKAHGAAFEKAVENLNVAGLISRADMSLVEAAMLTEHASDVLKHLGQNTDEAFRIAELPPVQRALEMDRLARQLKTPPKAPALSKAPAPIAPVTGDRPKGEVDPYDDDLTDAEYFAAREAAWKRGRTA